MNYKRITSVLIALLIISSLSLGARYIYLNLVDEPKKTSVTIENVLVETPIEDKQVDVELVDDSVGVTESENNITSEQSLAGAATEKEIIEAPLIELDNQHPSFNHPFVLTNLLPGDNETKYYCLKVYHEYDLKVYFESTIQEETKNLGDALQLSLKQVNASEPIIASSFRSINKLSYPVLLPKNDKGYTNVYYQLDVSLDSSTNNAYQGALLKGDFKWYVSDEEYNALDSRPTTGDNLNLTLWGIWFGTLGMLLFIYRLRRKEAN